MILFKNFFNPRLYLAVVLFSFASTEEKQQAFPLQDYVPVDFFRHYFSISPRLNFDGSNRSLEMERNGSVGGNTGESGEINLHHEYRKYLQTREFSGTSEISVNGGHARSAYEPTFNLKLYPWYEDSQRQSSLYFSAFSNHSGKWYLTEKTSLGVRLDPKVTVERYWRRVARVQAVEFSPSPSIDSVSIDRSLNNYPSESQYFDLRGSLLAGYGKIRDVSFAAKIMFLVDRIQSRIDKNLELNFSEMKQLEAFVESRRKERSFFDSRSSEIFDVESIEIFLRKKWSIEYFPARVILEMADEWHFTKWQERLSGWEVKLFPYFQLQFRDGKYSNNSTTYSGRFPKDQLNSNGEIQSMAESALMDQSESKFTEDKFYGTKIFGLGATMAYHLPYRRFYQASASITSRFEKNIVESGITTTRSTNPTPPPNLLSSISHRYMEYEFPGAELGLNLSLAFFPSSRTSVFLTENTNYRVKFDYTDSKESLTSYLGRVPFQDSRVIASNLALKVDYFLGHRLKLEAYGSVNHANWHTQDVDPESENWSWNEGFGAEDGNHYHYSIGSGIKYYLF